jgi:hypothetical protein
MGSIGDNQLAALSGYTGTIQDRIRKALVNPPTETGTIDDLGGYLGRETFWSDPSDESNLVGWYRPSGIDATLTIITQWNDDSPEANHLDIVTGINPQSTGSIGGVTCARFTAANSIGKNLSYAQPMSIFIVAQSADTTNVRYLFSAHNPFATNNRIGGQSSSVWRINFGADLDLSYSRDTSPHVFSFIINGSSTEMYEDGVLVGSGNVGGSGFSAFTLGGIKNTFQCFDGDVGEAVFLNKVANTVSHNRVGNYLANIYGTTWNEVS